MKRIWNWLWERIGLMRRLLLVFTNDVRASMAEEAKKLAWRGGAVFAVIGILDSNLAVAVSVAIWWLFWEVLAHWIMAVSRDVSHQDSSN